MSETELSKYLDFIERKSHIENKFGFDPVWMPDFLFPFQQTLIEWSVLKGRGALFTDCGTGKTPLQLVWSENVIRKTNGRVLIIAPLAVSFQTIRESEKFDVECHRSMDGTVMPNITVTNYERLSRFDPNDFIGVVVEESGILKSFDGAFRNEITEFLKKIPYRLLCTATAAPNDYTELGTSSEALGFMGYMDMLNTYFVNDRNNSATRRMYGEAPEWRFCGHAELKFWRWVCSWARAVRKPSDLGFPDGDFILPPLIEREHMVEVDTPPEGALFSFPASNMREQRIEKKRTIEERCEKAASLVNNTGKPAICWCHLNPEGDLLEKMIPDAIQVSGRDKDEAKEEKLLSFTKGEARVLVIKPKIGAWGLNWQHCSHVVYFPSHSYEQRYQAIRRCWRFGQKNPVVVDTVLTEGERKIMENLSRKSEAATQMFSNLVASMHDSLSVTRPNNFNTPVEVPVWL